MPDTPQLTNFNALVVDDEALLRQAAARMLNRRGFRCDVAANGLQALELLKESRYDLVMTDLRMPELNGHALAVELLARKDRPIVMVVTGVTEPKLANDLRARGVDEILYKPVDYMDVAGLALDLVRRRAELLREARSKGITTIPAS